ncbi:MAG: GNAT family N-acetyltransferase [Candidatus Heimdallarchaeota archaeon]|nr:GNAT family N-acetyltransferase [Candidatus Heimdallarchaeota archaeon]
MKIRQATLNDFEEINNLTAYCYGFDPLGSKERLLKRWELTYDENFCIEDDKGKIIANTRMITFDQFVRGKSLKMGGIAMVASEPLARRQGNIRESMNFLLNKMYAEKFAVSTLYPFKDTFYANYGYVNGPPEVRMKFNPKYLSRWKSIPEGYRIERLPHEKGFPYLKEIHKKVIPTINGGVLRNDKRWKEYDTPNPVWYLVIFNSKNIVEAVVKYSQKGFMIDFEWAEEGKLTIFESYILTPNARASLYHYLFLHSDQINKIQIPIDDKNSTLYPWLQGYYITELSPTNIWMSRVVNIENTIQGMIAKKSGQIKIKIIDEQISQNNQTFEFTAKDGLLSVKKLGESSFDIEMSIKGLSALVYGFLSVEDLEVFEWIKINSEEKSSILNNWFPLEYSRLTEGF